MYECVVKHSELSQKCSRKASQLPSHTAQLIISPTEQFLNWFHFFFHTFLQITAVKINQIFFPLVCFHRVRVVLVSDTDSHRLKKRKSKNRRDDSTNKKSVSPTETSSTLNATARFFYPKLMFPFIYNLDGGDGGFLWHCREPLVTKVREGQTNQCGPPKWFGSLWMREASFCFFQLFFHTASLFLVLYYFVASSAIIYTHLFLF